MENKRPLLLISNDDGYQARGIHALVEMLSDYGDIVVCAPESARSGFSCAFSATDPLLLQCRERREGLEVWSCNGTPVDCVKIALEELVPRRPDLIIGGINHGDNASVNVHYSGTMGVALEGCMKYISSVAFSLCDTSPEADFSPMRPLVRRITEHVLAEPLPLGVCLNVNFPLVPAYEGVRVCRMARGTWGSEVVKCRHPRGYDYWWMVGAFSNDEPEAEDTDRWALSHGYVAITPIQIDVTAYQAIEMLKEWNLQDETVK